MRKKKYKYSKAKRREYNARAQAKFAVNYKKKTVHVPIPYLPEFVEYVKGLKKRFREGSHDQA